MTNLESLTDAQKMIMRDFYRTPDVSITLDKNERRKIWNDFVENRDIQEISHLENQVPALYSEVEKALNHQKNIQPAVFSECVYAQGLADKFHLPVFINHPENFRIAMDGRVDDLHGLRDLTVRYSYSSKSDSKTLFQAGGANGVDCALRSPATNEPIMIEMKEPYAKTSEPDLPKYGEDGFMVLTDRFHKKHPQFGPMLSEQIGKKLNFFEQMGSNISDFSTSSIEKAVTDNYAGKKFAHVICTEDENGFLVMLPANHVGKWAALEGEIRPSGKNPSKVWTPNRLLQVLRDMGAVVNGGVVRIPLSSISTTNARGGKKISRYKINPLFFVREQSIEIKGSDVYFSLGKIQQLIPTVAAKMNFKGLNVVEVRNYYKGLL